MQKLCLDYLFQNSLPPPLFFFVLDCKLSSCASLPFLFSSPPLGLAYVGFRMYIPELCCETAWEEDLFLPLSVQFLQGEKPWAQSAYLKTFQIQFVFAFSVFQVWSFPCRGERDWHKENNECNFFPLLLFTTLLFLPLCVSLFKRESLL